MRKKAIISHYEAELEQQREKYEKILEAAGMLADVGAKLSGQLIETIDEVNGDCICGRWVNPYNRKHTATIYKQGRKWCAALFEGSQVVSRLTVIRKGDDMVIEQTGSGQPHKVILYPDQSMLVLGIYGVLERDDAGKEAVC